MSEYDNSGIVGSDDDSHSDDELKEGDEEEMLSFSIDSIAYNSMAYKIGRKHDYIELTGTTSDRKSIKVDFDFKLYFYLKLPNDVEESDAPGIASEIKEQLKWEAKFIDSFEYEEKTPARPFQFRRKFKLLKLIFNTLSGFRHIKEKLRSFQINDDADFGSIQIRDKLEKVILFETEITPVERFCQTQLNSSGWMTCSKWTELDTDKDSTMFVAGGVQTDRHIRTELKYLKLEEDVIKSQSIPFFKTLAVDIETTGLDHNASDAAVLCISQICYDSETDSIKPYLFTWHPLQQELLATKVEDSKTLTDEVDDEFSLAAVKDGKKKLKKRKGGGTIIDSNGGSSIDNSDSAALSIEGVTVINCRDEEHCLRRFVELWRKIDPCNLVGHNFYGFDLNYMIERAKYYKIEEFEYLGRNGAKNLHPKTTINQRSVYFHNLPGRLQIDTQYFLMANDRPQPSYSLDVCCETHLKNISAQSLAASTKKSWYKFHKNIMDLFGKTYPFMLTANKGDIPGADIPKYFFTTDESKRMELFLYCIKDSLLTLRLFVERLMFIKLYKMGQAFRAPIQLILTSGKQEQVMPNILTKMYRRGILFNKYHDETLDPYADLWPWENYDGGYVRKPIPGKYKTPVAVFDFGGMYPSIMMEHKVCSGTVIPLSKLSHEELKELENYKHIKKDIEIGKGDTKRTVAVAIIQEEGIGFSFEIQEEMKKCRDAVKAKMKATSDEYLKTIYDCEQLAYKLYMNGMYGLYAPKLAGKFTYLLVAAIITQFGREMSKNAGEFVLNLIADKNPRIVYGDTDSLMIHCELLEKVHKTSDKDEIQKLSAGGIIPDSKTSDSGCAAASTQELVRTAFAIFNDVKIKLNASFKSKYVSVDLEKLYYPFCLYDTKKYYLGIKWLHNNLDEKKNFKPNDDPDVVGVDGKKRDRCEHLRNLQYQISRFLLSTSDTSRQIEELITTAMEDIANGKVPIEKFIIVKALSKNIESYDGKMLPHVEVAKRNFLRGNLDAYKKGARISYIVYTDEAKYGSIGAKNWKVSNYCEDAKFAINTKMRPDYKYYIEYHYAKSLRKILTPANINFDKVYAGAMAIAKRTSIIGQHSLNAKLVGSHFAKSKKKIKTKDDPSQHKLGFMSFKKVASKKN